MPAQNQSTHYQSNLAKFLLHHASLLFLSTSFSVKFRITFNVLKKVKFIVYNFFFRVDVNFGLKCQQFVCYWHNWNHWNVFFLSEMRMQNDLSLWMETSERWLMVLFESAVVTYDQRISTKLRFHYSCLANSVDVDAIEKSLCVAFQRKLQ